MHPLARRIALAATVALVVGLLGAPDPVGAGPSPSATLDGSASAPAAPSPGTVEVRAVNDVVTSLAIEADWAPPPGLPEPAALQWSLDGRTWLDAPGLPNPLKVMLFDTRAGGDPAFVMGFVYVRWSDGAGGWTNPAVDWVEVRTPDFGGIAIWAYEPTLPISFAVSPGAATGRSVTITAALPDGFRLPPDVICRWSLLWGDDDALFREEANDTFGNVSFDTRPRADGSCGPWTFELPYTTALQYAHHLEIVYEEGGAGVVLYASGFGSSHAFLASAGSTFRGISASNIPLVYVLPNRLYVAVGSPVTYTAYGVGMAVPSNGIWTTEAPRFRLFKDQLGGRTFTFTPAEARPYYVLWDRGNSSFQPNYLAGFDPIARLPDRTAPVTGSPRECPVAGPVTTTAPVRVRWTGSDRGWGIERYELQESRNGGAWRGVALPSARSTEVLRRQTIGSTYRYRVRARDRAGNVGAWAYGRTQRTTIYQEGGSRFTWKGAWTTATGAEFSGGAARSSVAAGATSRVVFWGSAVAWVAPRGPDSGLAQVWIDGVLSRTIDLVTSAPMPARVVYAKAWSAPGTHTLVVKVVGTSGRPRVDVDAVVVLR